VNIFRTDSNEVRGKFYFPVLQVHCVAKIHNALVVRIGYWEREVDAAGDALVGPRIPELFTVENGGPGSYVDTQNPGVQRAHGKKQRQDKEACTKPQTHGRKDSMCGHSPRSGNAGHSTAQLFTREQSNLRQSVYWQPVQRMF
jgi:hypothetical protein